jgi:hypothetical protein
MGVARARTGQAEVARPVLRRVRPNGVRQLDELAEALSRHGPPVVIFCASHSGSRLLAAKLMRLGVFMGSNLNESLDSLDAFALVRHLIEHHAPDYRRLFEEGDATLPWRIAACFGEHLRQRPPHEPWGWKLPETAHALPAVARLFPKARFVHLIRDGRDVAFSPFVAPKDPFWRKVYFNDERIRFWRGLAMTQRAYRAQGPLFNAARWVNTVTLGRAHGVMLADRYMEMRYEALVSEPASELAKLADFLGLPPPAPAEAEAGVVASSVGKWRREPKGRVAKVTAVLEPTLTALGYV